MKKSRLLVGQVNQLPEPKLNVLCNVHDFVLSVLPNASKSGIKRQKLVSLSVR